MFRRQLRRALACAAVVAAVAAPAAAQEFGRNKVHYKDLDFQVLSTEHFDIYYYPSEQQGAELSARLAERWYARLSALFDHQLRGRQPLILYGSPTEFRQTTVIPGRIGEGTGGVTEPLLRRIVMPLGGPLDDTNHVLGHELVHAFQFDITSNRGREPGRGGIETLPLWFVEGMAEYLSIGPVDPNTAMWLRDAVVQDAIPSIADLDDPKYFPYRWGQAFWAYVAGRWGDAAVPSLLVAAADGGIASAFMTLETTDLDALSKAWEGSIRETYSDVLRATSQAANTGRVVIKGEGLGSDLNVGPALSPDGRRLAFLSQRDFFSTDLYIADAGSGAILRKLTSTATDPHFSSLESIGSSGGWNPDGTRIAIGVVTDGHPAIAIFDAASGDKVREIAVPGVTQIVNPSWAPDGHTLAFTGLRQGLTDLYLYDIDTARVRQLTNDPFADLQPAWSPDGRRIAFATDRFATNLVTLGLGQYELALMDPSTGAISRLRTFEDGSAINPQWSPDGSTVFFVSDRTGIPNVYGVTVSDGAVRQFTSLATGVSGITSSSPALSVARTTGTAAFSLFRDGGYDIRAIETQGAGRAPDRVVSDADVLPPRTRRPSEVVRLRESPTTGLPARQEYPVSPYHPSLQLVGVAQPSIGVGASRFGTTIGGGVSLAFADLLNRHELLTSVQFNSAISGETSIKDLGAQAAYLNQTRRWTWGLVGGQAPYLSGGYSSAVAQTSDGEPIQIDTAIVFRQTERTIAGLTAYPFDESRRVEFQAGVSHIGFDRIEDTQVYSLATGLTLAHDSQTTSPASPLTLGTASAAYVFDTANLGPVSPVQGQRYRIEIAPTMGSIRYASVLADYRKYFMPAPFYTIAVRGLHYGRYGAGGEDQRLFPLYIGYPQLVRGYDLNTFSPNECVATAASVCPVFDRLQGSRFGVGNIEFRFPLLRPFGVSRNMYGPLPVEVAFFADGGVAWSSGESPAILGGDRRGVASAGLALRANILGFAIGEFSMARPFQRPGQGWEFQFSLSPGF